ncbi:MAG TPA: hypoxanthine-guanine phosphoribosyltransferase [Burkholderiales bacterium]|nr:hypoxanthine-guanine phosphoribosyltransferase [Burkholderiales bacterium]
MKATPEEAWRILQDAEEVCSADCVATEVARIAREIAAKLQETHPLVLGVMRGSVLFAGQLLPQLRFPLHFDYLDVTRYGSTTTGGEITWKVSPGTAVEGRVVLVIDDILDEGHTLAEVRTKLLDAGATQFYSAVFAQKDIGRAKPITADFVGITVPNRYVFGFGMDAYGWWRNLPAIYAMRNDE